MGEDETLYSLSTKYYHITQEKSKIFNSEHQSNPIDNSRSYKPCPDNEWVKNEQSEMPNQSRSSTGVTTPSQAPLEIEVELARSFAKEFMKNTNYLEDFLEENYIWANKSLTIISEDSEINKLSKSIEKTIKPQSLDSQKCLTLKVKNAPQNSWLIPNSEISIYFNQNFPKLLGGYIKKKKDPTIYINAVTRLSITLKNDKFFIKESETVKPTAMILIEDKKIIESHDRFRVGTTLFDFDLKFGESIALRCTKENGRQILHKWNWDDNTAIVIGRGDTNSISIAFPEDKKMSKRHCSIEFLEGNWVIINQKAKNGVWNYLHNKKTMSGKCQSREIEIFKSSQFSFQNALFEVKSIKIN
ncbi:unnamed protein product [Blepharisma stoltei]|uniref:FHA domain-containing protein n=1 Tax=Blepharisma stoltei TaxID=1481888 RepID=A0AAU9IKB6_9CILI|nr:unnamed protein product [Blepharisma stoltei]